jgi:formylglycine-generating enzyme required for sulfatase activity
MAGLLVLSIACLARQAAPQGGPPAAAPADPKAASSLPGFVQIPPGEVLPGCTDKEYVDRHRGNTDLKKVLVYDIWGSIPPFMIPAFKMGRYEVTNAQWKHYLDKEFRTEHTTAKGETLRSLAGQYVKFRGEPVESEWKAIYALNWRTLVDGWQKAGVWGQGWPVENPPSEPGNTIENLGLPEGLKLFVYKTRIPQHWYGWCRLSGLGVGREYCDPSKPPSEAFMVPDEEPFKSLALAEKDFSSHPARSTSLNEGLAFAEWAGCQFATEYEWERAARGDNLRWPYCFGTWDHDKQKTLIAGAENERCRTGGPLRVDDESVSGGDSPFGARHMAGNVWEMTRTFYDVHPNVVPEPPRPDDIANYAMVAKGGSFGDRWQLLMVCARTGIIGEKGVLSLRENNRADSLGMRLIRHDDRPGYDLMLHTIRRLSYDAAASDWSFYLPHGFAMERMAGTDDAKFVDTGAPYVYAVERVHGIAVAPLWTTTLDASARGSGKPERNKYFVLGAFRSDVALKAGVRLTDAEMRAIVEEREKHKNLIEAFKKLPPAKQKNIQIPPPPPPPDEYEKLTEKNKDELGLWREKTVAPGEWFVVYWNGFVGLVNKNLTMPPDAILMIDPKQVSRKNEQPQPAQVTLDAAKEEVCIRFDVWEQPSDKSKQVVPPGPEHSEKWALCEAMPAFFIKGGPSARPYCWQVDVAFKVASGDDPVWKALAPGAPTRPPEKKPPGKAEPEDKKTTEK